jgi:hypothetical protein
MPLCDIKTRLDCGNYASDSRCLFRQYRLSAGEVLPSRNESRSMSLCSAEGRLPVVRRHFPPQSVGTGALLLVSENRRFSGAALTPPPSEKTPNNSEIICCDIPPDVVRALDDGHDCIPCQNVSPKSLRTPVLLRRPVLIRANNSSDRRRCGRCCSGAFFPIFPGGGNFPSPKSEKAFEMTVSSDSFRGMRHFSKISCLENTIHYAN